MDFELLVSFHACAYRSHNFSYNIQLAFEMAQRQLYACFICKKFSRTSFRAVFRHGIDPVLKCTLILIRFESIFIESIETFFVLGIILKAVVMRWKTETMMFLNAWNFIEAL